MFNSSGHRQTRRVVGDVDGCHDNSLRNPVPGIAHIGLQVEWFACVYLGDWITRKINCLQAHADLWAGLAQWAILSVYLAAGVLPTTIVSVAANR